jgi:hypothetical protein
MAVKQLSNWTIFVMFVSAQIIGVALLDVHSMRFEFRWIGFVLLLPASALVTLFRLPSGPTINIANRIEFELSATTIFFLVNVAFWTVMTWYFRKRSLA